MEDQERIATDQWVDQYGDYLYRYALMRLQDPGAAEEVVQDTFLAGIRAYDQYRGDGAEQAWLLGILKRKIIDWIRKRRVEDKHGREEAESAAAEAQENWAGRTRFPAPEKRLSDEELWQVVQDCLKKMPKGQADVFVLSVMEGMSTAEICEELDITPSNLWARLHRARLRLANCVNGKWSTDEERQHASP